MAPPEIAEALSAVYRRVVPDWPRNPWARPGLDALGGSFSMPYAAMVVTAKALPPHGRGSARFSYGKA